MGINALAVPLQRTSHILLQRSITYKAYKATVAKVLFELVVRLPWKLPLITKAKSLSKIMWLQMLFSCCVDHRKKVTIKEQWSTPSTYRHTRNLSISRILLYHKSSSFPFKNLSNRCTYHGDNVQYVACNVKERAVMAQIQFLPPAIEVCEGYVFTGVCLSTGGVSLDRDPLGTEDGNERAVRILLECILVNC